jgi:hypothetical protein
MDGQVLSIVHIVRYSRNETGMIITLKQGMVTCLLKIVKGMN